MDTRNSVLVVGVYLLGAAIIVGVAIAYYAYERSTNPTAWEVADSGEDPGLRPHVITGRYAATVSKSSPTMRELQASLAATRSKLDKSTTALNQKNAECRALQDELDRSFALLLNLLEGETAKAGNTAETVTQSREKLEAELARLKVSLDRSESLETDRERQLVELQVELVKADIELAMIQAEAGRELEVLTSEKRALEATTAAIVGRCGMVAVPWLVDLLSDERVEIRRWAARALGAVGTDAQDASFFLQELLSDPDEEVRTMAQQALAAIHPEQPKP
jgi:hypothetical protein